MYFAVIGAIQRVSSLQDNIGIHMRLIARDGRGARVRDFCMMHGHWMISIKQMPDKTRDIDVEITLWSSEPIVPMIDILVAPEESDESLDDRALNTVICEKYARGDTLKQSIAGCNTALIAFIRENGKNHVRANRARSERLDCTRAYSIARVLRRNIWNGGQLFWVHLKYIHRNQFFRGASGAYLARSSTRPNTPVHCLMCLTETPVVGGIK